MALVVGGLAVVERGWVQLGMFAVYASMATLLSMGALMVGAMRPTVWIAGLRQRRRARRHARARGENLVEAMLLVGKDGHPGATTALVGQMLAMADRAGVTIIAQPRNERVARMYETIGFALLPPGPLLLRPPRGRASRHRVAGSR